MKCAYGPHVRFMNITGMYMKCTYGPNIRYVNIRGHLKKFSNFFVTSFLFLLPSFFVSLNARSCSALALYRDGVRHGPWLSALVGHGHSFSARKRPPYLRDIKGPFFGIGEDGETSHEYEVTAKGLTATSPSTPSPGPFFLPTSTTIDLEL